MLQGSLLCGWRYSVDKVLATQIQGLSSDAHAPMSKAGHSSNDLQS